MSVVEDIRIYNGEHSWKRQCYARSWSELLNAMCQLGGLICSEQQCQAVIDYTLTVYALADGKTLTVSYAKGI